MFDETQAKRQAANALNDTLDPKGIQRGVITADSMRMVAYLEVRGSREIHFKNDTYPDHRVVVSYVGYSLYIDVYERVTRFSRVDEDGLFDFPIDRNANIYLKDNT